MGAAGPAGGVNKVLIVVMVFLGMFIGCSWCQDNGNAEAAVYIVTLRQAPATRSNAEVKVKDQHFGSAGPSRMNRLNRTR